MGKWCLQASSFIFYWIFIKLAGNQDRHKISDEFEFRPDRIRYFGVTCPCGRIKFSIDILWNLQYTFQTEFFVTLFLGTVRPRRLKREQWADVSYTGIRLCCLFIPLLSHLLLQFLPIFLKLCMCFCHGMRMCMWFWYNCEIIFFCHFFHFVNLVIFWPHCIDSGYLVSPTPDTILYRSFWNFAHVFSMVWRCACGLYIILALIFVTFSTLRTLSFLDLRFYESV